MYRWHFDLGGRDVAATTGGHLAMNDVHVRHRLASLAAEARAERLALAQRRPRRPVRAGRVVPADGRGIGRVRDAVGRALIGLGSTIAGRSA